MISLLFQKFSKRSVKFLQQNTGNKAGFFPVLFTNENNFQMKSSLLFLSEQAFFIARAATLTIAPFTLRADCGHCDTHRIQEMHFLLSAVLIFSLLMACAGQFSAQSPQLLQFLSAFGTSVSSYTRLPYTQLSVFLPLD